MPLRSVALALAFAACLPGCLLAPAGPSTRDASAPETVTCAFHGNLSQSANVTAYSTVSGFPLVHGYDGTNVTGPTRLHVEWTGTVSPSGLEIIVQNASRALVGYQKGPSPLDVDLTSAGVKPAFTFYLRAAGPAGAAYAVDYRGTARLTGVASSMDSICGRDERVAASR